jgi:hypothetical protein
MGWPCSNFKLASQVAILTHAGEHGCNALYFATHQVRRPRGWNQPFLIGRYWRAALVVFFNYGVDTGTIWKTLPFHEPILWRHVSWDRQSPDREIKESCPWGWLFYRRVKTDKTFWRPMNRTVQCHLKSLRPDIKDLRKTCATCYDEHVPESSVEILGHSAGGLTYRHYAHRAPLAFRAILSLRQPSAFKTLARGYEGRCPCCRRSFAEAQALSTERPMTQNGP